MHNINFKIDEIKMIQNYYCKNFPIPQTSEPTDQLRLGNEKHVLRN